MIFPEHSARLSGLGRCSLRGSASVLALGALLVASVGCTTRQGADPTAPPVSAIATLSPQQADQTLLVQVDNGQFDKSIYEELPGATRLIISTQGGPYVFSIDNLVDGEQLRPNGSTQIDYDVSRPGRYILRVGSGTGPDAIAPGGTAILDVRPAGER